VTVLDLLPDDFPRLAAGDYVLREILPSDAPDWHAYLSDQRVYEYTSTPILSLPDVEGLIGMFSDGFRKKRQIRWALITPDSGRMIGDLGYNDFWTRDCRAEIGYGLAPDYWRRGLMTRALASIIDYGFEHLALNKVQAGVNVNNDRFRPAPQAGIPARGHPPRAPQPPRRLRRHALLRAVEARMADRVLAPHVRGVNHHKDTKP